MRTLAFAFAALVATMTWGQTPNPVTNGSFEKIGEDGTPVDWETVGTEAAVVAAAHDGRRAVLLRRTPEIAETYRETGLNRTWQIKSGEQGKMLDTPKGGLRFWYTVPKAEPGMALRMNVIAMNDVPLEGCGVPRTFYQVPQSHFGDGQWHEGLLAFDYTDNDRFRWLQVSPRVIGAAGAEWIIDDIRWVESVGALPSILSLKSYELPDGDCQIRCVMKNMGDAWLQAGMASIAMPAGVETVGDAGARPVSRLAPGAYAVAAWRLRGVRKAGSTMTARFVSGDMSAEATCDFQPALDWVQFQTERFVLWPGQETTVDVVAFNRGDAQLARVDLDIALPPEVDAVGRLPTVLTDVPPFGKARVSFKIRARKQTPSAFLTGTWRIPASRDGELKTEIVVGTEPDRASGSVPRVACGSFTVLFPKNAFGYGIGWVYAKPDFRPVGVIPNLGRVTMKGGPLGGVPLYAPAAERTFNKTTIGASRGAGLRFELSSDTLAKAAFPGQMAIEFTTGESVTGVAGRLVTCRVTATAPPEGQLLALDGPVFCPGEGAFRGKSEALVPGMEWILDDEDSSNNNVISHTHPHRLRWRQHPHLVTVPMMSVRKDDLVAALLWHPRARWNDGVSRADLEPDESDIDRPTPVFAAPDRFSGHASAAMGLSVPSVGTYAKPNQIAIDTGWPAPGVKVGRIDLSYAFYVETGADSALAALKAWFQVYGVAPPRDLPQMKASRSFARAQSGFRGGELPAWAVAANTAGTWLEPSREQWIDELEWSMQGYLKTLWDDEMKEWRIHHGGPPIKRREGAYPNFLYDVVTTAKLTDDPVLKRALEAQAEAVVKAHNGPLPTALDFGCLYADPLARFRGLDSQLVGLLRSQGEDGGWCYKTRIEQGGTFKGRDYAGLAHDGFEANGLVARKAWSLLRGYRLSGEPKLLAAGLKALTYMEKFRVPRAAQVWEVIGHAPDILAAADACEAYLEAYGATGDKAHLERAIYWGWAGLSFVYQWGVDGYPWLRYGSIPIFGSTWWTCTWFGRPVQWNGMRYANALLQLAEHDDSFPWETVAKGILISGLYQQGFDPENEENYALWPDVYNAVTGNRVEWNFAPRRMVDLIQKFLGYTPEPRTLRLEAGDGAPPIIVNGCARFVDGGYDSEKQTVSVVFEDGAPLNGRVVIVGVTEPKRVSCNGRPLDRAEHTELPGTWTYSVDVRALVAFPRPVTKGELRLVGVRSVANGLSPGECKRIAFEFAQTAQGWTRANHITVFAVRNGMLDVDVIGGDPYMVRGNCAVDGDSVSHIRVRMSASAGSGTQFFWGTAENPGMSEDRRVDGTLVADGQFHETVFDVGAHPQWRGNTITAIRLDPMSGADTGQVKIDWIRGEK
ncbi:MAG: hypothetical protein HN742_17730 [Lentisphaerae bacterium]|nr:hypothetical protein [Lentisphaerota bacterium]MBT5611956.1 hypothetical protein [Lentisphaerota bacterium]MBT7062187.1 hypothetical protein [Lentisphaerota bacterium]MBT7843723.1 hypothetical protein [Lentisphaerota bacterium]